MIDEQCLATLPEDAVPETIVVHDQVSPGLVALAASEGIGYTRVDDAADIPRHLDGTPPEMNMSRAERVLS